MKIYENVLPVELLLECQTELRFLHEQRVWQNSSLVWPKSIQRNVVGVVNQTMVGLDLAKKINEVLFENYFSKYQMSMKSITLKNNVAVPVPQLKITYQHYIWNKMSGISMHDDTNHLFGATVYLNETWDVEWGGVFLWKDKKDTLKALCPKLNTMVVNDEQENHMVTEISPYAPGVRMSIQIWGDDLV